MKYLLSAVLCCGMAAMASAKQIDNPQYLQWAKFKVGAFVTVKSTTDMGEYKTESEVTTKLIEITAEKAVVEMTGTTVAMGNKVETAPQSVEIPAKFDMPETSGGENPKEEEGPKPKTTEGEEEVSVGGQTLKCKWSQTIIESEGRKTVAKFWMCEEVPGTMVKSETTSEGETKMTVKTWVVSFKAD